MTLRLPVARCAFGMVLSAVLAGRLAAAQTGAPMTAAEFEAYATGKTLSYAQEGVVWGSEQYLPGHKVIWAFSRDDCQYGSWFEDNGGICFVYENDPAPQCWRFFKDAAGLRAEYVDDPENRVLSEVRQTAEPLQCPGPEVGV